METTKFKLDPANPPKLSADTEKRMAAMTPAEIEAGATADADNPPLSPEELDRLRKVQMVKAARAATGLPQEVFAREFRVTLGRLRDLEQGRTEPDDAFLAYMALIRASPIHVRSTLTGAFTDMGEPRGPVGEDAELTVLRGEARFWRLRQEDHCRFFGEANRDWAKDPTNAALQTLAAIHNQASEAANKNAARLEAMIAQRTGEAP